MELLNIAIVLILVIVIMWLPAERMSKATKKNKETYQVIVGHFDAASGSEENDSLTELVEFSKNNKTDQYEI